MTTGQPPIDDDDLRDVVHWLEEAISSTDADERRERVGRAVRALTRVWSQANPRFDGDAWYPVSAMLTEHWTQIRVYMADTESD